MCDKFASNLDFIIVHDKSIKNVLYIISIINEKSVNWEEKKDAWSNLTFIDSESEFLGTFWLVVEL